MAESISIRDIIKASGMTQAAFADCFLIPRRTVEDWCSGKRTPPPYLPWMIESIIAHAPVYSVVNSRGNLLYFSYNPESCERFIARQPSRKGLKVVTQEV